MRWRRPRISGKYFRSILIWISLVTALLVLAVSLVLFTNAQSILLQKEYNSNLQVFEQVRINIDMMDTMSSNLCKYLYLNSDVESILYAKTEDMINETTRINRVAETAISANSFVHSITFYNSNLKKFLNAGQPLFFDDPAILILAGGGEPLPKARAIIRPLKKLIGGKTIDQTVFSYFMFSTAGQNQLDGALVVNIHSDWFLDNIRLISQAVNGHASQVFALADDGRFIEPGIEQHEYLDWLKSSLLQASPAQIPDVGYFRDQFAGQEYLISFTHLDKMGISILKVQELSVIFQSIRDLQQSVLVITLILLLIAIMVAIGLSRLIYRPIGLLVKQVASKPISGEPPEQSSIRRGAPDEIAYLSEIYSDALNQLDSYRRDSRPDQNILRQYWLNRLVTQSQSITGEDMDLMMREGQLALHRTEPLLLGVILIDSYRSFQQLYDEKYQGIIKFAILNIAAEVLLPILACDTLDLKDDHLVILTSLPDSGYPGHGQLELLARQIQAFVNQYFKVSLSLAFSKPIADFIGVTEAYRKTSTWLDSQRFKQGYACVWFSDDLPAIPEQQEKQQTDHWIDQLCRIVRDTRPESSAEAQTRLDQIFQEIARLDYDTALISLIKLASSLHHARSESGRTRASGNDPGLQATCRYILDQETLAGIRQYFNDLLDDWLTAVYEPAIPSRNRFIKDTVCELIQKHYTDSNLSLTSLAALLNLPSRRLSKVFKEESGLSVADYLNDIRLVKAAELLTDRSMNISEIAARVGIDNETYFYGLFKKRYGLTPKEYAIRAALQHAGANDCPS